MSTEGRSQKSEDSSRGGAETQSTEKKFLIWSVEHGAWWRPDHLGYTRNRPDAGRYSLAEASYICAKANQFVPGVNPPHECMVPEEGLA